VKKWLACKTQCRHNAVVVSHQAVFAGSGVAAAMQTLTLFGRLLTARFLVPLAAAATLAAPLPAQRGRAMAVRRRALTGALVLGVSLGCGSSDRETADTPAATAEPVVARTNHQEFVAAAESIVSFLRGENSFDTTRAADTVVLHISPEGSGDSALVPRALLRNRSNWRVSSSAGTTYRFVPPSRATQLTTRAGTHFNCLEYPLASRFPDLAEFPHVAVKLVPPGAESCLQSWNLTFVFAPDEAQPTLLAVVYDQWEW
jgi:hypothetical protein